MAINSDFAAVCPAVGTAYVTDLLAPTGTELTGAQVEQRINIAWAQTRALVSKLSACGGADTYCEIAALMAAHFVVVSERQLKNLSVAGEWSESYLGQDGLGLNSDLFGQAAISLDCSGILAEMAAGIKRTSFKVYSQFDIEDADLDAT